MNPLDLVILFLDKAIRVVSCKNSPYLSGNDRRQTFIYKKKQEIVKNVWTVALILMAVSIQFLVAAAAIFAIALFTTFLSFAILDETIEKRLDK